MCCPLVFEFSVGIGGFVIGLGQISFFFSVYHAIKLHFFSMRKVKASNISVQVQHVYEPYFLYEKNPALSDVQR